VLRPGAPRHARGQRADGVDEHREADPGEDPEHGTDRGNRRGLRQELAQHVAAPGAERFAQADLTGALRHRHEHDVHDHDAADHERHDHDPGQDHDEDPADPGPELLDTLGRVEHEVVVLPRAEVAAAAHDALGLLHRLAHLDLGGSLHEQGIEDAGRWSLVKRPVAGEAPKRAYYEPDHDMVEHIVLALLRRYGVVFWRLLQREAAWLPAWRDMLRVLRRLEARGDIRGGRFVAGVSGEQFALPEAVTALRDARRAVDAQVLVSVSGADPLNLVGVITPGAKVPALLSNRVLYRDGVAIATLVGGEIAWLESLTSAEMRAAEDVLVKRLAGSPLLAYLR